MFTQTLVSFEESQRRFEEHESVSVPARQKIAACGLADPRRLEAEAFIRGRFHRTHGAHIATFMPDLLLMKDERDRIQAILGSRRAEHGPLFLERYLAQPIEETIAARTGARVRRSQIVEVGNFAATNSRTAGSFMSFLAPHFLGRELTWVVFTATNSIRRILASLGARCADLGAAQSVQAAHGPDRWGSYYSHDPRVMAGYLPLARRIPSLWNTGHAD